MQEATALPIPHHFHRNPINIPKHPKKHMQQHLLTTPFQFPRIEEGGMWMERGVCDGFVARRCGVHDAGSSCFVLGCS